MSPPSAATMSSRADVPDAPAPAEQSTRSSQVPRPFAIPGFKQPTLSFFPLNASGQFDLGYGSGSTQAQPMQRQVSSRPTYATQPQYSTAPPPTAERLHHPSSYSYSTTHYDQRTTPSAAPRYSMYQGAYYDSRAYEPSLLSSRTEARTSDYEGGSDAASSPSSSLFSVFSAESTTTKSSVYEENPELRGRAGTIPTFVNVRSASDELASSKESYSKSPYHGRSALPRAKESIPSRAADPRQPLSHSSTSNLPPLRRSPPRTSGQPPTPSTSRPAGRPWPSSDPTASPAVTIDTGSPWARYPHDDIEAAYENLPAHHAVYEHSGPAGAFFSQPELVSLDAQGRPVIYDEPERARSPSSAALRRVTSFVNDKPPPPPPRRLRKMSTPSARQNAAAPAVPQSTMSGGLTIDTRVPPVGFPGDDVRLGGSRRSAIPLPDIEPPKFPMSRIEALRSRKLSNPVPPPALDLGVTVVEPSPATQHRAAYVVDRESTLPRSGKRDPRGAAISRAGASTPHPLRDRGADLSLQVPNPPQPSLRPPPHQRMFSESDLPHPTHQPPVFQPIRRHSDGEVPLSASELQRARSVRWNDNLICPSPVLSSQRRKGWFNRRGDQLWTNDGAYRPPRGGDEFPPDLDGYPENGQGWMNEDGVCIDAHHRLVPKVPLRSALKRK